MGKKTKQFGLKVDHKDAFRRTVKIYKDVDGKLVEDRRYQLVFEPNTPYDLDEVEQAACKDLIDGGLLVEWIVDSRGRQATPLKASRIVEGNRIAELELDNAALAEQVTMLIQQLTDLGETPCVEVVDEGEDEAAGDDAEGGPIENKPKRRKGKKAAGDDAE